MSSLLQTKPARFIRIRAAEDADMAELLSLRRAFFRTQIEAGLLDIPATPEASLAASTAQATRNCRRFCFVAAGDAGELEGYLLAQIRFAPGMEKASIGSIEEVYVSDALRGTGTAADLLERAISALKEAGAERLQARVLALNAAARAFWRKYGFLDNVIILERGERK